MKKPMRLLLAIAIFTATACTEKKETENTDDNATVEETTTSQVSNSATIDASNATKEADDAATDVITSGQTYTDAEGIVIYNFAEVAPSFTYKKTEGADAITKYLITHIKYPNKAEQAKIEGKVIIQFIVTTDGSVKNVTVAKGSNDESLDAEATRVVANMPNWVAGQQGGENVNVKYTQPITFKLPELH